MSGSTTINGGKAKRAKTFNMDACGGCGATKGTKAEGTPIEVYTCTGCGGLVGRCYKGESFGMVLPYFVTDARASELKAAEDHGRYFDLTVLGGNGVERRHGWFDQATKGIIQVG